MHIRLLRDWRVYRAGATFVIGDGAANLMIRRGLAERIADDPPPPPASPKPAKKATRKK